jgi:hypothetical protein
MTAKPTTKIVTTPQAAHQLLERKPLPGYGAEAKEEQKP